MKKGRLTNKENNMDIIKKQSKTIYQLQEEIRCLKFDKTENVKLIYDLKLKLKTRNKTFEWIIEELEYAVAEKNIKQVKKTLSKIKRMYGICE